MKSDENDFLGYSFFTISKKKKKIFIEASWHCCRFVRNFNILLIVELKKKKLNFHMPSDQFVSRDIIIYHNDVMVLISMQNHAIFQPIHGFYEINLVLSREY